MLHIVTGKINSGKTTKLHNIYKESLIGDGFISKKNMDGSNVHSYDIVKLSTNESKLFVIHENFFNNNQEVACTIGPYHFLKDTLTYIEQEIKSMIKNNLKRIYLDEIGMLEMYDQCFHQIFKKLLESNLDIYVAIREDLIDKIMNKYRITEYKIIT